jgi:hypothetical protein
VQIQKLHSFVLGVVDFFVASRHLFLTTAIDNRGAGRTQPHGRAHGIHGRIATTNDSNILAAAIVDRGV